MAVWRLLEFYCCVVLMLCLYMFRNVFIQIFFRTLSTFIILLLMFMLRGWLESDAPFRFAAEVRFFPLRACARNYAIVGINVPLKLAHLNENASRINMMKP